MPGEVPRQFYHDGAPGHPLPGEPVTVPDLFGVTRPGQPLIDLANSQHLPESYP
jgi:hypothetical protein